VSGFVTCPPRNQLNPRRIGIMIRVETLSPIPNGSQQFFGTTVPGHFLHPAIGSVIVLAPFTIICETVY
jgi:hypothetical protein